MIIDIFGAVFTTVFPQFYFVPVRRCKNLFLFFSTPLDLTNYTKKDNLTSAETTFLSYALTQHILSGNTDKLPLKEFFNNCSIFPD